MHESFAPATTRRILLITANGFPSPVDNPYTVPYNQEKGIMKFSNTKKIKVDGGDYIVLVDYGIEGIAVRSQHDTLQDALLDIPHSGDECAIVRLVEFEIAECREGPAVQIKPHDDAPF